MHITSLGQNYVRAPFNINLAQLQEHLQALRMRLHRSTQRKFIKSGLNSY